MSCVVLSMFDFDNSISNFVTRTSMELFRASQLRVMQPVKVAYSKADYWVIVLESFCNRN